MALLDRLLAKFLRHGELRVAYPDGSAKTYGTPTPGAERMDVRFADRRVAADLLRHPAMAIGETYMDGRLIVENGDILDLLVFMTGNRRWETKGGRNPWKRRGSELRAALDRRNWASRAKRNVAHHYDLTDRLYDLFLDADRQYSCAYFTHPGNSLEQAQADKKAHIAAKLYLKPGQRVLDIGCGWGGMALYLNRVADVDVLGITLSEEQLKVARRRAEEAGVADRVKFALIDYRAVEGAFDRIVSVGMFEHVGPPHYRAFFRKCRDLLSQDGVMLLHTIGRMGSAGTTNPFTSKYIFPGYYLPSMSQMTAASEKSKLIAADVEMLRLHYALTLRRWLANVRAARDEIIGLYDERFYRMWEFYLAGAAVMFENGGSCIYQIQYLRDRRAVPITRDYLGEAEARYRALG